MSGVVRRPSIGENSATFTGASKSSPNENRSLSDAIVARVILAARARARAASRAAASSVTRKAAGQAKIGLPRKLADCASNDPAKCELFIVEGDSVG